MKEILGMLKHRQDKEALLHYMNEHGDYFRNVDGGTYRAIAEFLQSNKLMKKAVTRKGKEGEGDMCKALDDLYNDGIEMGENQKLITQIQKKLTRKLSVERIAQEVTRLCRVCYNNCMYHKNEREDEYTRRENV